MRYEALKERTEKDAEEARNRSQMARTEDTIQIFLAPGPVAKRHKMKVCL